MGTPSHRPQEEVPALLPAWMAGLVREPESPPCVPPSHPRCSPEALVWAQNSQLGRGMQGPEAPSGQDAALGGRVRRVGRSGGREGLAGCEAAAAAPCLPPGPALMLPPQVHPQPAAPWPPPASVHPPSPRGARKPLPRPPVDGKAGPAPSTASLPSRRSKATRSTATRGPSGHVYGLGSAQAKPRAAGWAARLWASLPSGPWGWALADPAAQALVSGRR